MTDTRQHTTIAVIAAGLALAAILPAKAQDTPGDGPRTVVVEREYDPEIGDADKIDLLPPAERKSAPATEAEYALTARPYTGKMELNTLGTGYSPTPPGKAGQGMAYAGYGSGGTADAGLYINPHRFNDNEIYVKALFSGVNSDRKPYTSGGNAGNAAEWHARHYGTDIAAGYGHSFELLDFYVAGSFGLDNFNLRPTLGPEPVDDRGRHTKGRVKAGIRSEAGRLGYDPSPTPILTKHTGVRSCPARTVKTDSTPQPQSPTAPANARHCTPPPWWTTIPIPMPPCPALRPSASIRPIHSTEEG